MPRGVGRDAADVAPSKHLLPVRGPIDLDLTFTCGQAFRWARDGDAWSGVIGRSQVRVARVAKATRRVSNAAPLDATALEVEVLGEPLPGTGLRHYFRSDEDPAIHLTHAEELRSLPGFESLLGLRLLRQDPWETLASFICSAAANIRKITTCVEGLAGTLGDSIAGSNRRSFPEPEAIAGTREKDLRALGLGFRAPYLRDTARAIARDRDWSWDSLRREPIERARDRLASLTGVGPKIADCVLLFGLDRLEAYPVDRWIRRATMELSNRRRASDRDLALWAARLGPGRGYLQQLIFHLRRTSGPLPALSALSTAAKESAPPARTGRAARQR